MQVIFRNKRRMPAWGTPAEKAAKLAEYRTDPDKWFQRPGELAHVAFRAYFEHYTIQKKAPKSEHIVVYQDAKGCFVYERQKRRRHLVSVRTRPALLAGPVATCARAACAGDACQQHSACYMSAPLP